MIQEEAQVGRSIFDSGVVDPDAWYAAFITDEDGDQTMAEVVPLPNLVVGGDWVEAYDFSQTDQIALIEVHRDGSSICSDEFEINGAYAVWLFCWEQDQVILPGDLVTLSVDGEPIKDHIVQYLTFDVADFEQRRFAGTAYSGSVIELVICDADYFCLSEYSSPVSGSSWEVIFADIPFYVDWFAAFIADEDGDQTQADLAPPPNISYHTSYNWLNVNSFPPDSEISVEIFTDMDMAELITSELLYTDNQGNLGWDVMRYLNAGSLIIVDFGAGEITRELVIENISLENVNLDSDQASGYAPEDMEVFVVVDGGETGWFEASTFAGPEGWLLDFGADHAFDLTEEHFIWIYVVDEDGDQTQADVGIPPAFTVHPEHGWVGSGGWPVGISIELIITDPVEGIILQETQVSEDDEWNPGKGMVWFDLWEIADDLMPGVLVSLSGSGVTKETVIVPLSFDAIDPDGNASGIGPAGGFGHVCLDHETECQEIEVSEAGKWTATFDWYTPDMTELYDAHVVVWDDDGDETMANLPMEEPPAISISAYPQFDQVDAIGFPAGTEVTLVIDDDQDPENGNLLVTTEIAEDLPGEHMTQTTFLLNDFDLLPGHYLITFAEEQFQVHQVIDFSIMDVDLENDFVSGLAAPEDLVEVWIAWSVMIMDEADATGDWTADFGAAPDVWDIQYGDLVSARILDDFGNGTWLYWIYSPWLKTITIRLMRIRLC